MADYRKDMCTCINGKLCESCINWGGKLAKGGYAKSISGYSGKLAQLLEKLPAEQRKLEELRAQNIANPVVGFYKVVKQQREKVYTMEKSIASIQEKIAVLREYSI